MKTINLMDFYLITDLASNYRIDCNEERIDDTIKEVRVPYSNYILFFNLVVSNTRYKEGTEIALVEVFDLAVLDENFEALEVKESTLNQIETTLTKSIYQSY